MGQSWHLAWATSPLLHRFAAVTPKVSAEQSSGPSALLGSSQELEQRLALSSIRKHEAVMPRSTCCLLRPHRLQCCGIDARSSGEEEKGGLPGPELATVETQDSRSQLGDRGY